MTSPLAVGVIGVGSLGRHHARHLAGFHGARLAGVCDVNRERAEAVAAETGTTAYADIDAMLPHVDAVTIAVPTLFHLEVGLRVMAAGKPVLIEKPLARTVDEADQLVAAAEARGVQLQVGHIERFNRAIRAAREHFKDIRYFEGARLAPFQLRGTDVAVVHDLMIHDLDLVLHLMGGVEVTDVRASGVAVVSQHLDIASARVEFANGAVASITASRIARERVRKLRLFQPDGYFSLDLASGTGNYMRLREGARPGTANNLDELIEHVSLSAPPADALGLELASFVHAVRGDQETVVTGREGRAALALAIRVTDTIGAGTMATAVPPTA